MFRRFEFIYLKKQLEELDSRRFDEKMHTEIAADWKVDELQDDVRNGLLDIQSVFLTKNNREIPNLRLMFLKKKYKKITGITIFEEPKYE